MTSSLKAAAEIRREYGERYGAARHEPVEAGTPIQGTWKYALMARMVQGWIGKQGVLEKISASYRGIDLEGEVLTARGMVRTVEDTGEGKRVLLEVWVENEAGARSTAGVVTVRFAANTLTTTKAVP